MFDVITLATSKGGAGKSTLARSLAAHWLMVGQKPALIDADPQRTLANRHDPAGKLGAVPLVAEPEERVAQAIEELRGARRPIIVDTAASKPPPRPSIAAHSTPKRRQLQRPARSGCSKVSGRLRSTHQCPANAQR